MSDLEIGLRQILPAEYSALEAVLTEVLKKLAPLEQRIIGGNSKQLSIKDLRKAVMLGVTFKIKAHKSGKAEDFEKYKKQRNQIVKMNRKAKFYFFRSIEPRSLDNDKKFWKMVKLMFSNSSQMREKLVLIEVIISDDTVVTECFNSHFINIIDSLGLDPMF